MTLHVSRATLGEYYMLLFMTLFPGNKVSNNVWYGYSQKSDKIIMNV